MIHAPSLAIGAGIASVAIIVAFLALDIFNDDTELAVEPTPTIQESGPAKITASTFLENGSPVLDRKSTRLNSSHSRASRMPSSA